jgi:hypothetical protein
MRPEEADTEVEGVCIDTNTSGSLLLEAGANALERLSLHRARCDGELAAAAK